MADDRCLPADLRVWQPDRPRPYEDTALFRSKLEDVGILHNTATERGFEENQWWRHTVIGDGEIDWARFLAMLHALPGGLPALSFEMEDYQYECRPIRFGRDFGSSTSG